MAKANSYYRFKHSFAAHLLDRGDDLRAIQELLGHRGRCENYHYLHTCAQFWLVWGV